MSEWKRFWKEEDAVGVVELVLIIVVIITIVILFRDKLKALVNKIFKTINTNVQSV